MQRTVRPGLIALNRHPSLAPDWSHRYLRLVARRQYSSNWQTWITIVGQALLTGTAVLMSLRGGMFWPGTLGLGILGLTTLASSIPRAKPPGDLSRWILITGWVLSCAVPASLLSPFESQVTLEMYLDKYVTVLSWVVAAAVLPASRARPGQPEGSWKMTAMVSALFATIVWLVTAYAYNYAAAFFPATLVLASLLVYAQLWWRLPHFVTTGANTLVLLLIGLPLADLFIRPGSHLQTELTPDKRYYAYEVARRDPAAFRRWWGFFCAQFEDMGRKLYVKDPTHRMPFRLRPGGEAKLFQSTVHINSRGFRGRELSDPKGEAYQIVCLGESTTFGCTLNAGDTPWPQLLEAKIRSRLRPSRPVEVINAGTPSFTLQNNLARLEPDILPLQPDMLISYHGYNGFQLLHDSFPATRVSAPPAYIERSLRLLALVEYRARLLIFRKQLTKNLEAAPPEVTDLLKTPYGEAYAELAQAARTNHFRLAIATHAMAVNQQSLPDVIEFYRAGFPPVYWLMAANRLHSQLVEELVASQPQVRLINGGAHLDGEHDKFIDLVHLTQQGREQLAENVFEAIRPDLELDLQQRPVRAYGRAQ